MGNGRMYVFYRKSPFQSLATPTPKCCLEVALQVNKAVKASSKWNKRLKNRKDFRMDSSHNHASGYRALGQPAFGVVVRCTSSGPAARRV